ncbi:MAG TPA: hypothetical protein VFC74_03325, partial [Oscillospiraceae bacterium]|nr:hypothetical protein [Oscillospiraceae bacterium]
GGGMEFSRDTEGLAYYLSKRIQRRCSMDNENQIFELMTKMYAEMQKGLSDVRTEMQKGLGDVRAEMQRGFKEVNDKIQQNSDEIQFVKGTVVKIETEHGHKLGALFDGYKLNAEKLDRIEKNQKTQDEKIDIIERVVTKHDVLIKNIR